MRRTPLLLLSGMLLACSGETAPDAPADVTPDAAGAREVAEQVVHNAAGIPGAVAFELAAPVRWLSEDDQGSVWVLLYDGTLGKLVGDALQPVVALAASTGDCPSGQDCTLVVHPPPAIAPDGTVVVVEAVLDNAECKDYGTLRWIDPKTLKITIRELQVAPRYPVAVTSSGIVLSPTIEYKWQHLNDPVFCQKTQPQSIALAAYTPEKGLLWSIDQVRPAGPPTLSPTRDTAWFSDGSRTLTALNYDGNFGEIAWQAELDETGSVGLSNPALGADERLFVAGQRNLAAFDGLTGAKLWEVEIGSADAISGEPVITASGSIVVAGTVETAAASGRVWTLFEFDAAGVAVGKTQLARDHLHKPGLAQMGLTILEGDTRLSLVGPGAGAGANSLVVWRSSGDPAVFDGFDATPPLCLDDGSVLLSWQGTKILRATLSTGGLTASTWPRWSGSNRRDGASP